MSIQEILRRIKPILLDDSLFYTVVILLVALSSFGLGRLSVAETKDEIDQNTLVVSEVKKDVGDQNVANVVEAEKNVTAYVASKNGTKYHLPWCPGASQIKEENKIVFASKEEAEASGYTPASNCKGI